MELPSRSPARPDRGRGTPENPPARFEELHLEAEVEEGSRATRFYRDPSRSILSSNDSPDLPFTYSVNPYRGCEHGCAYCYARPTHEYLGWSAGLDFESRILVKLRAPELLRAALSRKSWTPQAIAIGGVTDCYQPVERSLRLTRRCLEVLQEFHNPVALVTKSAAVPRDLDVLRELARWNGVRVYFSLTTLDDELAAALEPRAARPRARLEALRTLAAAGVPTGAMLAPVIPGLNDREIPALLRAAAEAGAQTAGWQLLRLPHGVKELFQQWLARHAPLRRERVLARLREVRNGRLSDATFGRRMRGTGQYAAQIADLFRVSAAREGLAQPTAPLSTESFRRPGPRQNLLF